VKNVNRHFEGLNINTWQLILHEHKEKSKKWDTDSMARGKVAPAVKGCRGPGRRNKFGKDLNRVVGNGR
jgi:hypothetical protein